MISTFTIVRICLAYSVITLITYRGLTYYMAGTKIDILDRLALGAMALCWPLGFMFSSFLLLMSEAKPSDNHFKS